MLAEFGQSIIDECELTRGELLARVTNEWVLVYQSNILEIAHTNTSA